MPSEQNDSASQSARPSDEAPLCEQKLLLIHHTEDHIGNPVLENLRVTLQFAKMKFDELDLQGTQIWPDLSEYSCIVICTVRVNTLLSPMINAIQEYSANGGGILVAIRAWHPDLATLFGISRDRPTFLSGTGIVFDEEIIPGAKGLSCSAIFAEHSRFNILPNELASDCTILASTLEQLPLAWVRMTEHANIVFWNTNHLANRKMRGFFLHTLFIAMGRAIAAKEEFAVLQIDDFPAALSDGSTEPIDKEYADTSWNEFIFDVWYADMMKLRDTYALKYTWYAVINYDDTCTDINSLHPLEEKARAQPLLEDRLARMTPLDTEDEIALHGYNHVALTEEHWPRLDVLEQKLGIARELWAESFQGKMPTSWVPVNNQYNQDHIRVLKQVFPEIDIVCGLYTSGKFHDGESREFGPEPWEPSLFCLPRETYGYTCSPGLQLAMLSQIASMGIWTHFVHPDDIFDIPSNDATGDYHRNQDRLRWRSNNANGLSGMFSQFENWIAFVKRTFPWMKFLTTSQAHKKLVQHQDKSVTIKYSASKIETQCSARSSFYIRTRPNETLKSLQNSFIQHQVEVFAGKLYSVQCGPGRAEFVLSVDTACPAPSGSMPPASRSLLS